MLLAYRNRLDATANLFRRNIPDTLIDELQEARYGENNVITRFCTNLEEKDHPEDEQGIRVEWMGVKYGAAPHRDPTFPRWSYFLIVHNPGFYIGTVNKADLCRAVDQEMGAVLALDLHQLHWLAPKDHEYMFDPTWVAVTFHSKRKLAEATVHRRFRAAAKEFGALAAAKPGPLKKCQAASSDGECIHRHCPQNRDGEPDASGRSCPLDWNLERD